MKGGCHWRDHPYRVVKALRSRLAGSFPRVGLALAGTRFLRYPAGSGAQVRARLLGAGEFLPWEWPDDGPEFPDPETRRRVLEEADRIRRHRFDILGSGLVDHGGRIRWHLDPRSGHEWPGELPWWQVRKSTPAGADLKMPWELSRCHHLVTLAVAWRITGDAADADECLAQIDDWIDANPYPSGVNWACPMDVAIRLVNWLTALGWLRPVLAGLEPESRIPARLDRAIWEHGWHLSRHLEGSGPRCPRGGNHLYADLCGLLAAGCYFGDRGRRWRATARAGLEVQTLRQFLTDGGPAESSTSYQRLLLEMAVWSEAVCRRRGMPLGAAATGRISDALRFSQDTCDPAGNSPNVGDNDSGRLLAVLRDDETNHAYLWDPEAPGIGAVHHRLLGADGRGETRQPEVLSYPVAGFHVLRSKSFHVCVRAGTIGHGGAHAHCDQLALTVSLDGRPVMIDPGSYLYTPDPESRNRFRSAASHNLAQPEGVDQNALGTGRAGVFAMHSRREASDCRHQAGPDGGSFSGVFRYPEPGAVTWRRQLRLRGGVLDLVDEIEPGESLEFVWHFHFAPGWRVAATPGGFALGSGDARLALSCDGELRGRVEEGGFSPGYGRREPCRVLRLRRTLVAGKPSRTEFRLSVES